MPQPERPPLQEMQTFRAHVIASLPQARVTRDTEGWPLVAGRYGRLEWRGAEWATGEHRLYAYTSTPRMIVKLRALPGLHPCQIGDREAAFWLRTDDGSAIRAVAGLLRLKRRRAASTGRTAGEMALIRATSRGQERQGPAGPPERSGSHV